MSETKILPLLTWRSAICESDLSSVTRHVALTLSVYMNERGGSAFPGAIRLAKDTGLSERAIRNHLGLLVKRGWLVKKLGGGRGLANEYTAMIALNPALDAGMSGETLHRATVNPAPDDTKPCTPCTPSLKELSSNSRPFQGEFDSLWNDYPRKEAKVPAFKAYQARRRAGVSADELATALSHFIEAMRNRDREHILQGSTFFGANERWKDYLQPVAASNGHIDTDAYFRQFDK